MDNDTTVPHTIPIDREKFDETGYEGMNVTGVHWPKKLVLGNIWPFDLRGMHAHVTWCTSKTRPDQPNRDIGGLYTVTCCPRPHTQAKHALYRLDHVTSSAAFLTRLVGFDWEPCDPATLKEMYID